MSIGQNLRLTLCAAIILIVHLCAQRLPAAPEVSAQPFAGVAGSEVAEQIVHAYGGAEGLQQLSSRTFSGAGTLTYPSFRYAPSNRHVSLQWQPDALRITTHESGREVVLGRDTHGGWLQLGETAFPCNDSLPTTLLTHFQSMSKVVQALASGKAKIEARGDSKTDTEIFQVFKITADADQQPFIVQVDSKRLLRRIHQYGGPEIEFADYRQVGATLLPFSVSRLADSAGKTQAMHLRMDTLEASSSSFGRPGDLTPTVKGSTRCALFYQSGKVLLEGTVNGTKAFFAISNQPFTIIDRSLSSTLPSLHTIPISIGSWRYIVERSGKLDSTLSNPIVKEIASIYSLGERKPVVVLGQDFLRRYRLEIDIPGRNISFLPNTDVLLDAPDMVTCPDSLFETDLIAGVTAPAPSLPAMSFDVGAPLSTLTGSSAKVAKPVLRETSTYDGKVVTYGFVRLPVLQLSSVVGFKKPTFAVPLDEKRDPPLPNTAKGFGVVGAGNMRDFTVHVDYVNNRFRFSQATEVVAREFFLSMLDDLQARHFLMPKEQRLLLYKQSDIAARLTGNTNVRMLCQPLLHCLDASGSGFKENQFADMDHAVQLSRDRPAFGLFKALWVTRSCTARSAQAKLRDLQQSERRAPQQPYVVTKLAEQYFQMKEYEQAKELVASVLHVDAGYEDALALAEKLAESEGDKVSQANFAAARKYYGESN